LRIEGNNVKQEIEMVKELISILEENNLAELNIDFKGMKVEIKKEIAPPAPMMQAMVAPGAPMQMQAAATEAAPEKKESPISGTPVKSPLSGVFYRAAKPGAPPFVNVGDMVDKGQTLCIIEAMKLMNEISSEMKGRVTKVCKENAEVIAPGEILFYIETE
jgi:acetyl-CoA carboxylase biotin carboxyl carrier protein